ncbi:ELMO/CED-12 family-domain-containing protein, partial [Chytriomyces sp. MP71]
MPRYLRLGFLDNTKRAFWLLAIVYSHTILRFLYSKAKAVVRFATGTSELLRVVNDGLATGSGGGAWTAHVDSAQKREPRSARPSPAAVFRIDQCLLHSKRLVLERRSIEAGSTSGLSDEHVTRILTKKLFPPAPSPQALLLKDTLRIIAASFTLMHSLNARATTKYDKENKTHERLLLEFWALAMPDEKLKSRVSDQWQKVGFQGTDPATDFRGMGLLGLDDLVYYAKTHPTSFQRVLESSKHGSAWFSMAIVGINITAFALSLVRQRGLQKFFFKYGTSKEVYHEFYCFVFDTFERKWTSQNTFLTVMDFERVFKVFQRDLEERLETQIFEV